MSDPATQTTPNASPPSGPSPEKGATPPSTLRSEDLLRGAREVLIEHSGDVYRLRLTRNGKLILHK